ncbi:MAG: MopE-related protein, partial [Myxococcota bacterium]|nr:MopE-related protein [Myxococcota bacterium]
MPRRVLPPLAAAAMLAGCGTTWKVEDIDGDGFTPAEGDCWDSMEALPGSGGKKGDQIYPGAVDPWYDGIDQNCDGLDDYDADGDGWVPAEYIGLETLGVPGSGQDHPPEADCWDAPVDAGPVPEFTVVTDADHPYPQPSADLVNPGAAAGQVLYERGWNPDVDGWVDFWYDGVDLNCDGVDEFDQDGDGHASQYHPDRDGNTGDDCIDGSPRDDANIAETPASDVHPGAAEVWWDGTDQDCDYEATVDCDFDADGFRGDPTVDIESLGTSACAFEDDEAVDCNDELASVFPTEDAEVFYNGADDNCDYADRDGDKDGDGSWAM